MSIRIRMIARALFVAALCGWFASPVSATLHFFRRDGYCVDTVTTTITLTTSNSQVATVLSTVNDNGEVYYEPPLQTTAISSTALPASQYPTSSTSPHTVTITATQLVVQTKTVLESQTLTQTQYLVQTVYTSSLTGLQQSDSTTVLTETQTRTITSTLYNDISPLATVPSAPGASSDSLTNTAILPLSTHRPSYPNGTVTVPFGNFSEPTTIDNAPSTPTSTLSLLQASPTLLVSLTSSLAQVAPSLETSVPTSSLSNSITRFENTLYFANWAIYGAQYQPQSLPAAFVSRINYAFADIDSNGNVISSDTYADLQKHYSTDSWDEAGNNAYGCVKQLYILKKQNRYMKVLLSVGGWTWSSKFSPMAADPIMRQNFVSSAVQLVTDWGFDGIDVDWEFNAYTPTSQDSQNIISLLQALRTAFDAWSAAHASSYHFLITVASPAGPPVYGLWDLAAMDPYVDAWNLMAYDYTGSWSTASGHSSNIYFDSQDMPATPYSTDQAVSAYIAGGVASSKIILGMPLYGRSFEQTAGLGRPYTGVGTGDDLGAGQWRVKNLPRAGATEFYDNTAKASYSYDATTQELISYDNEQSVSGKSAYLKAKGLGGAMFWEASDDRNGTQSLVVAMAGQLGTLDVAMNLLNYPTSQYDNIRNGMPGS